MPFAIDNTTLALLGVLAALLLYIRFFALPSPLVHPLLLGKQSDVSAVRRKGETGIYRSFATGQGSPVSLRSPATRHDSDCSSPYDLRAR
jgi:long-chain acyl-CoA synthetase